MTKDVWPRVSESPGQKRLSAQPAVMPSSLSFWTHLRMCGRAGSHREVGGGGVGEGIAVEDGAHQEDGGLAAGEIAGRTDVFAARRSNRGDALVIHEIGGVEVGAGGSEVGESGGGGALDDGAGVGTHYDIGRALDAGGIGGNRKVTVRACRGCRR